MRSHTRIVVAFLALSCCSYSQAAQITTSAPPNPPGVVGQIDGGVPTKLPVLPQLTNVTASQREDSTGIDFDPVDGAVDYRVYVLPADADITVNSDGTTTVKNAIYRCAGMRQTFDVQNNLNADGGLVTPGQYSWHTQVPEHPLLGYVYPVWGAGRRAVYALAGYPSGQEQGWREARFKVYVTDATLRKGLLDQGWRDDGIAFYVPARASAATHSVYASQNSYIVAGQGWTQRQQYYFSSADVDAHRQDAISPAPAFEVLAAPAPGAVPLRAVFYAARQQHTELVAGNERFRRASGQGPGPLWHLEWSGLTGAATLVVEALSSGCPYRGFLAAKHLAAPPHQTFVTLAELAAASPSGNVFINGQYDGVGYPKAIARSFVGVTPQPHAASDWDWYQGFTSTDTAPLQAVPGCTDFNCGRWRSSAFDISAYRLDKPKGVPVISWGQVTGQLWEAFDDAGSDVTGKVRFTALQKATVAPANYLHVTMSVNIVSSDRRYPQMIISDQPAPVQEGLSNPNHNTLLVQPIRGPSMRIEAQAIHGLVHAGPWDVNNQAPEHRLIDYDDPPANAPFGDEPPLEHAGMDRMTRFDVYVSSKKMYFFFDGTPAGCTQFPAGFTLNGPVTVTFGDVLYHEGAQDELICSQSKPYPFMHAHQCTETIRHFDDLGFKSAAAQPVWDETRFPCGAY